jgi:Zn-finger nucleic acid-binding protein
MLCPRGGTALESRKYEAGIEVDGCARCGGVWLDHGELEAIQHSRETDRSRDLERMDEVIQAVADRPTGPASCPKCGAELAVHEYAHCSRIHVDTCPEGHGVWLDGGELEALEVFFEEMKRRANAEDDALWAVRGFWVSLRSLFRK